MLQSWTRIWRFGLLVLVLVLVLAPPSQAGWQEVRDLFQYRHSASRSCCDHAQSHSWEFAYDFILP